MPLIQFFNNDRIPPLKDRKKLKLFLKELFIAEKRELHNLTYIFCSDKYLLEINKQFLKHDFYTDVITFDLSQPKDEITGEIYISVDRVKENAQTLGVSINNELHRVIFHGALHLCGYKDKRSREIKMMKEKEDLYLSKYFK